MRDAERTSQVQYRKQNAHYVRNTKKKIERVKYVGLRNNSCDDEAKYAMRSRVGLLSGFPLKSIKDDTQQADNTK